MLIFRFQLLIVELNYYSLERRPFYLEHLKTIQLGLI